MRTLNDKQKKLHWSAWNQAKPIIARGFPDLTSKALAEALDEVRYAAYERALGPPPRLQARWSLSDLPKTKLNAVLEQFERLAGTWTPAKAAARVASDRASLLTAIEKTGKGGAYAQAIAADKWQRLLTALDNAQLTQLLMSCKRAAKAATPKA